LKAAAISLMKRKASRISIATERRLWPAATGRVEIVLRGEIVAGAADGRAAAGEIVDVGGAVDARAVVAGGIADAAGRAGEDTRKLSPRIYADSHGWEKGHDFGCGLLVWVKGDLSHRSRISL
jgi:hypothetical protein